MQIHLLVTPDMQPIPERVRVVIDFGHLTVIDREEMRIFLYTKSIQTGKAHETIR